MDDNELQPSNVTFQKIDLEEVMGKEDGKIAIIKKMLEPELAKKDSAKDQTS